MKPSITTLGALAFFIIEGALQISGYQNPVLAWILGLLGFGLLGVAVLDWLRQSKTDPAQSKSETLQPAVAVSNPEGETARERMLRRGLGFGLSKEIARGMPGSDAIYQDIREGIKRGLELSSISVEFNGRTSSFYQGEYFDRNGPHGMNRGTDLYRIAISPAAHSRQMLKNVSVEVIEIETLPGGFKGLPLPLHFMHNDSEPFLRQIDIPCGRKQFVNVISLDFSRKVFWLHHTVRDFTTFLPLGSYTLHIQVTASNANPIIKCYRIYHRDDSLEMQEDTQEETKKPDSTPQEVVYLTAYETIHYMADESQWGHQQKIAISDAWMRKQPLLEAFGEFQRAAADGKITAWGRRNGLGEHLPMTKHYWLSAGLDMDVVLRPPYQNSRTVATVATGQDIPIYTDLKILAAGVYQTWPR